MRFKNSGTTTSNLFVIQWSVWNVGKKEQHIKKTWANFSNSFAKQRKMEFYNGKTYYLKASFPDNMSCHWKVTGMAGTAKQKTLFCHWCSCQLGDIGKYQVDESRCDVCRRLTVKRCYYHNLENDSILNMCQKKCHLMECNYLFMKELAKDEGFTFLQFRSGPTELDREQNMNHIDFVATHIQERREFCAIVTTDLQK